MTTPGVFCLEGRWSGRLTDRSSVEPILQLLDQQRVARYVHRDVATIHDFEHYLEQWLQPGYRKYGIGYFGVHGEPGAFFVGKSHLTLDDFAERIGGRGAGRVFHFGSCSTVDVAPKVLRRFVKQTKARAICGYREDVAWIEAAAMDLLVIESIAHYSRIDASFKWLKSEHAGFVKRLGFRMEWKTS